MRAFKYYPQLFEFRALALDALSGAGYEWLTDFTSIDLRHEVFGFEVSGIQQEEDALKVCAVLRRTLIVWPYSYLVCRECEDLDRGWQVVIHRDPEEDLPS